MVLLTGIVLRPGRRSSHHLQKRSVFSYTGPTVQLGGRLENTSTIKQEIWHEEKELIQKKRLTKRNKEYYKRVHVFSRHNFNMAD